MKPNRSLLLGILVIVIAISSCRKNLQGLAPLNTVNELSIGQSVNQIAGSIANPYSVTLIGPTQNGQNWDWVWAVKNNRPGNGTNGTAQDMSHWGMSLGYCVDTVTMVSAAYSNDGVHWTSFTPRLEVDPSSCVTTRVLKFDFGTNGSNTSYYRLTVNQDYGAGLACGYYKSGRRTGCGTFFFQGISCGVEE
jgi:hypothetical protein